MLLMIAGLVLFIASHLLPSATGLRDELKARFGEGAYKIAFSLVSVVAIIAIAYGFGIWKYQVGAAILYVPPTFLRHIALLLMLIAFILLAAMYGESHIRKAVKHPMLTGVKTWALAHLLANGDAAGVTLFGSLLAWAVVDRILVKRRERAGLVQPLTYTPKWGADVAAVAVGTIVYVLFVWKVHLWLIGVSPIALAQQTAL